MDKRTDNYSYWANSVTNSIEINAPKNEVYESVYQTKPRPNYLPSKETHVTFDNGIIQEFYFEVPNGNGGIRRVRTISRCEGDTIEYFQPSPTFFMDSYFVIWSFEELPENRCRITVKTFWNKNENANSYFKAENNLSTEEKMKQHFISFSSQALEVVKEKLEKQVKPI